jgi:hypothetical protein
MAGMGCAERILPLAHGQRTFAFWYGEHNECMLLNNIPRGKPYEEQPEVKKPIQ